MPATADLTVNSPPITDLRITKTPDLQTVDSGQTASFTISLRNEGETTITSLSVDDPLTPDCDRTSGIPDLLPVDSFSYTCQTDPLIGGFVNLATVIGLVGETPIEGSDTAQVNVVTPEIGITKTPDTQSVNPGEKATFTIKIVNNSSSTLTSISVEDPLTSSCERLAGTLADLAPGEMLDYTCEAEDLFADLTNVATASADGVDPVSDSVSVDVIAPVEISKDPAEQQVVSGEKATFTITITNPGAGTLTDVTVFDPSTPDCDRMIGTLGPGTSVDYPCETPELLSDLLNEATVTAQDPGGGTVSDSDSAAVEVVSEDIEATKETLTPEVLPGESVTFTITINNIGTGVLSNISVDDPLTPDCDRAAGEFPNLDPGESTSYDCDTGPLFATLINVATVSAELTPGSPPTGFLSPAGPPVIVV